MNLFAKILASALALATLPAFAAAPAPAPAPAGKATDAAHQAKESVVLQRAANRAAMIKKRSDATKAATAAAAPAQK